MKGPAVAQLLAAFGQHPRLALPLPFATVESLPRKARRDELARPLAVAPRA
jgi:hypothetical protein